MGCDICHFPQLHLILTFMALPTLHLFSGRSALVRATSSCLLSLIVSLTVKPLAARGSLGGDHGLFVYEVVNTLSDPAGGSGN